jgi:hypothetical protein
MKSKKSLCYALLALAAGCGPILSFHPLFTKETLTFDERLLGTWVDDVNKPESSWEFTKFQAVDANKDAVAPKELQDRAYRLAVKIENGRGLFAAWLVKLDGKLFLDLYPAAFPSGEGEDPEKMELAYNTLLFVRAHVFIKIEIVEGQLKMKFTDDEKFGELIKDEPAAVKYEMANGLSGKANEQNVILTASTKDLQAFVVKYADDERLFSSEKVLSRKPSK